MENLKNKLTNKEIIKDINFSSNDFQNVNFNEFDFENATIENCIFDTLNLA